MKGKIINDRRKSCKKYKKKVALTITIMSLIAIASVVITVILIKKM